MMNRKLFTILGGVTAVTVLAAVTMVTLRSGGNTTRPAPLVPGLTERLNQVTALTVSAGKNSVTVSRPDPNAELWTVTEKAGYPASLVEVGRVILALADAKTVEPRTAKPEQYAKLGVEDAASVRVALRTADNKELPAVLIGKAAVGDSFYARRVGEPQSWLVEGRLSSPPAADPLRWLNRDLPTMARERVMSVTIARPGGPALTVSRKSEKSSDFTLTGLPQGAKPKQSALNELAGAAEYLSFEDVFKADPAAKPDPAETVTSVRSFDGETLIFRIGKPDGKPVVSVSVSLETKPGKPDPAAEQAVKEAQARTAGWRYRLPEFAVKALTRAADELTEKDEKKEEKKEEKKDGKKDEKKNGKS